MGNFFVKFKGLPELTVELDSTEVADSYLSLLKSNYQQQFPIFRDQQRYTVEYLNQLAVDAKQLLGWDWLREEYTLEETTLLHKDLEQYLAQGYTAIPAEHDWICDELHYCLHAVESGRDRGEWLQVEWFNNDHIHLAAEQYPRKMNLEFGDIRLQNPHVGHHPLFVYVQQDKINIMQTCRFHDQIKPGFNILIADENNDCVDPQELLVWFKKNSPEFVSLHGEQTILAYTGHPVIGRVINLDDLVQIAVAPLLELESIRF